MTQAAPPDEPPQESPASAPAPGPQPVRRPSPAASTPPPVDDPVEIPAEERARLAADEARLEAEQAKLEIEERRLRARDEARRRTEAHSRRAAAGMKGRIRPGRNVSSKGGGWRLPIAAAILLAIGYAVYSGRVSLPPEFARVIPNAFEATTPPQAAGSPTATGRPRVLVVPELANIRAAASTTAAVVAQAPRDTALPEVARDGEWVEVILPGRVQETGWVHRSLLRAEAAAQP
jgi:hypothetical protein